MVNSVEFRKREEDVERVVNNAPPFSEVHSLMFVQFKVIMEDDVPFRYNAPPLEFAVQYVISVEFSVKLASVDRRMKRAPPFFDVHSVIFVEFKLTTEDDEPFTYNPPPLD